jgi:hypothetical protein
MGNQKSKWMISIVVAIGIIVGAGYYFVVKTKENAALRVTNFLHKAGFLYSKAECKGFLEIQCVADNVYLSDGTQVKKIIFNHVEQFEKVSADKSAKVNLDIALIGIDAKYVACEKKIKLFSIMSGKKWQTSDYGKMEKLVRLWVQGNMYIKGDLEFTDKKLQTFKNFGFKYDNAMLPFELFLNGSNKDNPKNDPSKILFTKVKFDINFKDKKEVYQKASKIIFQGNNVSDAMIDAKWDKFVKNGITDIEAKKAVEKNKLKVSLLNAVENILKGDKDMLALSITSKDNQGVSATEIIKNARTKYMLDYVNVQIDN